MFRFSIGEMVTIAVVAWAGVWLIDKGLTMAGLQSLAINNS